MKRNSLYLLAAVIVLALMTISFFNPLLVKNKSFDLVMQGVNILVFIQISYLLANEEKKRNEFQQKQDDNRIHKQLKFELVKTYINQLDTIIEENRNDTIKDVDQLSLTKLFQKQIDQFKKIESNFSQNNIRLINIFNFTEYDKFIYIQSLFIESLSDYTSHYSLNNEIRTKSDAKIISDLHSNVFSHVYLMVNYLYFILLNDSSDYDIQDKLRIINKVRESKSEEPTNKY